MPPSLQRILGLSSRLIAGSCKLPFPISVLLREAIAAFDRIAAKVAICVSEEFGEHKGLGIIPRRVTTITNTPQKNARYRSI